METALIGKFKNRKMQDAQEAILLDLGCDKNGLMYVTQYSRPRLQSAHYYYDPPSNVSFGSGPEGALDPYERKRLELRASDNTNMGEGVFAKTDIEPYMFLSSYNAFVFSKNNGEHEIYDKRCSMNSTKTDDERRHCIKYAIELSARDAVMNIPPEFDQPESFIPSLGPKVRFMIFSKNIIS